MQKNIIYIALALVTLFTSCDHFLTVEEKGRATIPSFLSDVKGLNAGLLGAYNKYYAHYDAQFLKYPEVAGDMADLNITSGSTMLDQYNYNPDPSDALTAYYIWLRIGEALANANNVIEYEPQVLANYPTQKSTCEKILGQALLLRAMCHFDLVRVYAQPYNYTDDASHLGVPIMSRAVGPDDNLSRSTVREVYEFILSDLTQAASLLTDDVAEDVHYGSLQAVNAMFSRVYLYMEDWEKAKQYADLAIGTQTLADSDTYLAMFDNLNVNGESILRLSGEETSGSQKTFYANECSPANKLIALYDDNDIRLQLVYKNGTRSCLKYTASTIPNSETKREDPIVFRLSEMFLNAAEASTHISGQESAATTYMRTLLTRNVGETRAEEILSATTDMLSLIQTEREKELCFEGHNLFDHTRWKQDVVREEGTSSSMARVNYPSDLFVLPIPQYELYANSNMLPNPTVNK